MATNQKPIQFIACRRHILLYNIICDQYSPMKQLKKKHQSIHDSFIQMYSVYLRVFHVDFSWNCLFFSSVFSVLLSQKLFLKEIKRKGEGDNTANLFHLLYWMWNVTLQLV